MTCFENRRCYVYVVPLLKWTQSSDLSVKVLKWQNISEPKHCVALLFENSLQNEALFKRHSCETAVT